ncbi:MAG: antibiotic biosynthesis monooxygenase family protein [Actinomycetota bacterium]
MITEHVLVHITSGQESAFEASVAQALPIITAAPGCHQAVVRRQFEDPSTYLLLIDWESVEAHMAFRQSDLFPKWKGWTWAFYDQPAQVSHFHQPFLSQP